MSETQTNAVPESTTAKMVKAAKAEKKTKSGASEGAGEVGTDLIASSATNIESLSREEAIALVGNLSENVEFMYFRLGGVLSVIQRNNWFHDDGYEAFRDFVEAKFGIHYRKAMYLVAIYNGLVESGVAWEKVKGLGWSKLKELASILTTDNVDKWVAIASNCTVLQLIEYIKNENKAASATDGTSVAPKPDLVTLSFKLHEDQRETVKMALEQAKKEAGTDFDAVALEAIAIAFISGGKAPKAAKKQTLTEVLEKVEVKELFDTIAKIHPQLQITVAE